MNYRSQDYSPAIVNVDDQKMTVELVYKKGRLWGSKDVTLDKVTFSAKSQVAIIGLNVTLDDILMTPQGDIDAKSLFQILDKPRRLLVEEVGRVVRGPAAAFLIGRAKALEDLARLRTDYRSAVLGYSDLLSEETTDPVKEIIAAKSSELQKLEDELLHAATGAVSTMGSLSAERLSAFVYAVRVCQDARFDGSGDFDQALALIASMNFGIPDGIQEESVEGVTTRLIDLVMSRPEKIIV